MKYFFRKKFRSASLPIMIAVIVMLLVVIFAMVGALGQVGDRTGAGYTGKMIGDDGSGGDGEDGGTVTISCGTAAPPTGPHTFPLARHSWYGGWLADRCSGTGSGDPHVHGGADIMHAKDDHVPVYAVVDGVIKSRGNASIYLKSLTSGDTYIYYYMHLSTVMVNRGDPVSHGQLIGFSGGYAGGANGDHTHFGMIRTNGCNSSRVEVPLSGGQTCSNTTMAEREQIACSQTCLVNPISTLSSWR